MKGNRRRAYPSTCSPLPGRLRTQLAEDAVEVVEPAWSRKLLSYYALREYGAEVAAKDLRSYVRDVSCAELLLSGGMEEGRGKAWNIPRDSMRRLHITS